MEKISYDWPTRGSWRIRDSSSAVVIAESDNEIKKCEDRKKVGHCDEGEQHVGASVLQTRR
jgi:hypothetical protein